MLPSLGHLWHYSQGKDSMFHKLLAEFHEPGYGPCAKVLTTQGQKWGRFLCPFRPSPWPHLSLPGTPNPSPCLPESLRPPPQRNSQYTVSADWLWTSLSRIVLPLTLHNTQVAQQVEDCPQASQRSDPKSTWTGCLFLPNRTALWKPEPRCLKDFGCLSFLK